MNAEKSAFPVIPPMDKEGCCALGYPLPDDGMNLRDWFAGQAISGLAWRPTSVPSGINHHETSQAAYDFADAMMVVRQRPAVGKVTEG